MKLVKPLQSEVVAEVLGAHPKCSIKFFRHRSLEIDAGTLSAIEIFEVTD
jgi:hypothetical protein